MKMETRNIPPTLDNESIEKRRKISKLRNYTSQIYATFASNIVKFATASFFGFTSVLVAEFHKEDSEIYMSTSDLGWFSSYCFMGPVACLFLGGLAQRIGARLVMLIATILCVASSLTFHFATNSTMILAAQVLVGLMLKSVYVPGMTYIVEITQPPLRGALTASAPFTTMFAAFLSVFLSNFLHWRTLALVMLVYPITGFIAACTIPESPHWLASKKKFQKAEAALCWLRGWSSPENVVAEFNKLKETHTSSTDDLDCVKMKGNINSSRFSSVKNNISNYLHRSFYMPLLLICLLFVLHHFTGSSPLLIYIIVIFRQIKAPIDPIVAASISDALRILGATVFMFTVHYTGKKKLVYITLTGAGLGHITVSIALLLKSYQIYPETCQWVATVAMMCTAFLVAAGMDKVVFILNAEIFPTKYRNVGTGLGLLTFTILQAITNKIFLPLLDAVTLPGIFIIFGISCIITCIMFHFMFPETEGKTLQEIENHYGGVEKLA